MFLFRQASISSATKNIDAWHVSMQVHVHQQSGQREKDFNSKCVAQDTEQIHDLSVIYSTSQQDGTYEMYVECLVFSIVVWILILAVIRYFPQA